MSQSAENILRLPDDVHRPQLLPASQPVRPVSQMLCDACNGTGRHAHFPARPCSYCAGHG